MFKIGASGYSGTDQAQTVTHLFIPRQPRNSTAFAVMSVSDSFHAGLRAGHHQNVGQNVLLSDAALAPCFHVPNKRLPGASASLVSRWLA